MTAISARPGAPGLRRRDRRHRPHRADARPGAAGQGRPGAAPRHPLERPAHRPASAPRSPRAAGGLERLLALTGNPVLPGFTAPKIVWVREHEPEVYDRVSPRPAAQGLHPLPADRRVRHRGLGRIGHVAVRRRRTGAGRPRWPELLDVPMEWLPVCTESDVVSGRISAAGGRGDRAAGGHAGGGRRRRPGGAGGGQRHRATGHHLGHQRHQRRRLRHTRNATRPSRRAGCTSSATRCRAHGTRWA